MSIVRTSGAVDVDGLLTLEEFADRTGYELPEGPYDTVAGYWVAQRGELPELGESVSVALEAVAGEGTSSFDMSVTELDGRRAARITVRRSDTEAGTGEASAPEAADR